jgi:hypothetical protein
MKMGNDLPIIKRALKPLGASRGKNILMDRHEMTRKTADALASHRVSLVRHRRRANLRRFERFFDFLRSHRKVGLRLIS